MPSKVNLTTTVAYDLLIIGGHVVDPANNVDEISDIAVRGGVIAAVGPDLPREGTKKRIRCQWHAPHTGSDRHARARF